MRRGQGDLFSYVVHPHSVNFDCTLFDEPLRFAPGGRQAQLQKQGL